MQPADVGADALPDRPLQWLPGCLHQGHLEPQGPSGGGHLTAEEARADHHHAAGRAQGLPQRLRVVLAAEGEHPGGQGDMRVGPASGGSPGGDHQAVVPQGVPVVEGENAAPAVEPDGPTAEPPFGPQPVVGQRKIVDAQRLGQRGPVVGQMDLFADEREPSVVSGIAQRPGGPQSGERGTDDHDLAQIAAHDASRCTEMARTGQDPAAFSAAANSSSG